MLDAGQIPLEKGYLLTGDDRLRREAFMRLLCELELDFEERGRASGVAFSAYFADALARLDRVYWFAGSLR